MMNALRRFGGAAFFRNAVKQEPMPAVTEVNVDPVAFIVTGDTAAERKRQLDEITAQNPGLYSSVNAVNPQKIGVVFLADKTLSEKFYSMEEIEAMMEKARLNSASKPRF